MKEVIMQVASYSSDYPKAPIYVADLVRCKDCKHAHMTYDGLCKYCDTWKDDDGNCLELYLDGDYYCADGERKDEPQTERSRR